MRLHVCHAGAFGHPALHPSRRLGGLRQRHLGGELQVHRHIQGAVALKDRDVVRFHDRRLFQRDREHPLAQSQPAPPWLDVDDDVAARQRGLEGRLDHVRGLVALDDGLGRRHGHDDVGEVAAGRLAQPQPAQLDVLADALDRAGGCPPRLVGRAVHEHVRVLCDQPRRRSEDDGGDDQGGDRVALVEAGVHGEQPDQHGQRSRHVAREVNGVGAQRGARVAACAPQRGRRR